MGTSHPLSVTTNNHAITGAAVFADIAARDADTSFFTDENNLDKVVKITSPLSYFVLAFADASPIWIEMSSTGFDEWTELLDTPGSITANLTVQGNAAGTALEFGQDLTITGGPTFADLTIPGTITGPSGTWDSEGMDIAASGSYAVAGTDILSDLAGVMTLSNVDALDATTETTIENALDTLPNLTSLPALVTVGALDSGSITSGFGSIDVGSDPISTTGLITAGSLTLLGLLTVNDLTVNGELLYENSPSVIQDIEDNVVRPGQVGHISTIEFVAQVEITELTSNLQALEISPDGLKYFAQQGGNILQYDMSVPGDITTGVFAGTNTFAAGFTITVLSIDPPGLNVIVADINGLVRFWTLPTPYDFDNAVQGADVSPSELTGFLRAGFSSLDGRFVFLHDQAGDIFQYSRPNWESQTLTYTGNTFNFGSTSNNQCSTISSDGRILYVNPGSTTTLREYTLTTPWDVSTAILINTDLVALLNNLNRALRISSDGTRLYDGGTDINFGSILQYSLGLETPMVRLKNTSANGANLAVRVGDRNPLNNITADPGDFYLRQNAELSGLFQNKGATGPNTDGWRPVSYVSSISVEIYTAADLENLATAGVITVGVLELIIKDAVFTDIRFEMAPGGVLVFRGSAYVYTGTADFITGTDIGSIFFLEHQSVSTLNAKLFNVTGNSTTVVSVVSVKNVTFIGWDMGEIGASPTSVIGPIVVMADIGLNNPVAPLVLRNCLAININQLSLGSVAPINDSYLEVFSPDVSASHVFTGINGLLVGSDSLIRIDAGNKAGSRMVISNASIIGNLFDISGGTTGTFTAVTDAAIIGEVIDSVSDNGFGNVQFNHSAIQGEVSINQEITISGFIINTSYNGTFIVFNAGVGFAVVRTPFIDNADGGVGSYDSDTILLTDTATTLSDGDTLVIDTDLSTDYDNGATVYNKLTNSFQINRAFTVTRTGNWNTAGIDQSDPRVLGLSNPGFIDSKYIGFGSMNGNTDQTTITDGAYVPIVVTGITENVVTERFKIIDDSVGIFEYTGIEPQVLMISATPSHVKTGSNQNYRYAMSVNGAVPVFASAAYQPAEITSTKKSTTFLGSASLVTGDTIQIMVAGDGTANDITVTDLALNID